MPLSWNEIKSRAVKFSKEWEAASEESAESQTFLNEFFEIFGIKRQRVATFEKPVKKIDGREGYIDLLWPGKILIEHKTKGKNLEKAKNQAIAYSFGLTEEELPQYMLVCDFDRFILHDLQQNIQHDFTIKDLVKNVNLFGFIAGYEKRTFKEEDPVNIAAAELMGKLHDKLKAIGYKGHDLEVYLVRLVFCLFADDTNIFNKDIFEEYLKLHTREDGSDLAAQIASLFYILNEPPEERLKNLDESLAEFPFVNGKLFEENLPQASFDREMRSILLDCCKLDWGKISPAIFGSLFQSVMNPEERRNLGGHYTSERNIVWIDIDQFYGIEIEEWPARISEVAMWLVDHRMNMRISEEFGEYFVRLPLKKTANIICGNALRINWETIVPKDQLSYILGNPPFGGARLLNEKS